MYEKSSKLARHYAVGHKTTCFFKLEEYILLLAGSARARAVVRGHQVLNPPPKKYN